MVATYRNACAMYDFRITAEGLAPSVIIAQLKKIAKRYTFQLEKGEQTGYVHYQGRFCLIKKHRKPELMKMFDTIPVPNFLEPTANPTYYAGDLFYVMKEETRLDGPWSEKLQEKYIPRQYRGMLERLYPYQQQIFDSAEVFDTRIINMIYCPHGNMGKSTIASCCELFANGIDLPPVNDAEKLIQSCCDICEGKGQRCPSPIFVDLPRAMNKDRLNGIYTAIEQIKKGKLFDLRYKYKDYWIDAPQIWVFSNIDPDISMLSKDRWKLWTIDDDKNLIPYKPDEPVAELVTTNEAIDDYESEEEEYVFKPKPKVKKFETNEKANEYHSKLSSAGVRGF